MIRLIVADHHVHTLAALKTILGEQPGIELVGESVNGGELLEVAATQGADVILLDRKLPGFTLTDLIAKLHALTPRPYVMVIGNQSAHSIRALHAGADAFVSKSDDPEWLLESIPGYSSQEPSEEVNHTTGLGT